MNTGELAQFFEARPDGFTAGVEAAAALLQAKADELLAIGNPTASMMGRIFEDQAAAIRGLLRE